MKRALPLLLALAGCAATPEPYDYGAYLEHMPRSILVLPPLDETHEADAPYGWLETVTWPLVEMGYYVFPVAMVDAILKEEGLPTPGEMHEASLEKLQDYFGADAVLYVTLTHWGTSYHVLSSNTEAGFGARLVDARTGTEIWKGGGYAARGSGDGGGGLAGALVGALVSQVARSASDPTPGVAREANRLAFGDRARGLLPGPMHPAFEEEQKARRAALARPAP